MHIRTITIPVKKAIIFSLIKPLYLVYDFADTMLDHLFVLRQPGGGSLPLQAEDVFDQSHYSWVSLYFPA